MANEIGDTIKFSNNASSDSWKKGFIVAIINVQFSYKNNYQDAFIAVDESGSVITLNNTDIHVFASNLFKPGRVLLCEKNIVNENKVKQHTVRRMAYELLLTLNRNAR